MTSLPKRILIVDDEPDIVSYFTLLLEEEGYTVFSASSAEEALRTARAERPHLISLDIMMPRRSGLACYLQIRLDPDLRSTPVLIVSAFGRPQDYTGSGFRRIVPDLEVPEPDGFIEKPTKPQTFVKAISNLVGPPF